jgi:uncharacterized RDD family membrane protein YckC
VAPGAEPATPEGTVEYMGFWIRFGAIIIDTIIVWFISSAITFLLLNVFFSFGISWRFPFFWFPILCLYYWLFTGLRGQTLGKMAVGIKVVNAQGSVPGLGRAALREIPGKIASSIVIYLGFLWIIWDERKQGWHDKIAKTYVLRVESRR